MKTQKLMRVTTVDTNISTEEAGRSMAEVLTILAAIKARRGDKNTDGGNREKENRD